MDDEHRNIPFVVYEAAQSRLERIIKKLWIMCLILIILLVGSNIGWLIYESQFEDFSIEAEQDGDGINIVGGGDIDYGAEGND